MGTHGDIFLRGQFIAPNSAGFWVQLADSALRYLPPYSPDFKPIEQCWGKVKQKLRSLQARTVDALQQAISAALATIPPNNASAWFAHCGYDLQ